MNPKAGRGSNDAREREVSLLCERLGARGCDVEIRTTARPNDAVEFAREAADAGIDDVIVAGGDGTINEALQGMVGARRARLGVWPRGTANVLARELSIPSSPERVAETIARGHSRRVHVGRATSEETGERRYFFLMAGVGLDASIVRGVRSGLKRRLGEGAFWYSGIEHLLRWRPVAFSAEVDGENFGATFAVIGNGASYGGRLAITPRARMDRNDFEVCLVDSRSRFRYLHLLGKAMRGGVNMKAEGVRYLNATQLRATGAALVQVDGELIGSLPMTFDVAPETIEILC